MGFTPHPQRQQHQPTLVTASPPFFFFIKNIHQQQDFRAFAVSPSGFVTIFSLSNTCMSAHLFEETGRVCGRACGRACNF